MGQRCFKERRDSRNKVSKSNGSAYTLKERGEKKTEKEMEKCKGEWYVVGIMM